MTRSRELTDWELLTDDGTVHPVRVPGTVTQAVTALDADERTWVFRTVLADTGSWDLVLEGVATAYEVRLDDQLLVRCASMHTAHRLPVQLQGGEVLEVRCLPLSEALPEGRPPRARWRSPVVDDNALRLVRTTLLGRCPGFAPGPPVVGPWRPVRLERQAPPRFATRLDGGTGVLTCSDPALVLTCAGVTGQGELRLPAVARWWPHTHGEPVLHDVLVDGEVVARVGFRDVANADPTSFDLVVNGTPVWCRGAVWTPPGLLGGLPEDPRATVALARDAGMNLLRVPGLAPYESEAFFAACDELGVMVWHDLALANLDVPHDLLDLDGELDALLARADGHPSLVAVCGGSETAQQVAMLGLDPHLWESDLLVRRAPAEVAGRAVWVPNAPWGGSFAHRVGEGVAGWFGVGGYRRPPSDVRLAGVRFASECLAFANPPVDGDGTWVPRDNGAAWDFADVREHYARTLDRPSESVVGELCDEVFGWWRRPRSGNRGGLVLWLRDLQPGSGWGLLDVDGTPKRPWWHLRRVLAPQAVWLSDEGMDGVAVHLAHDLPGRWDGDLRVALYRADGLKVGEVVTPVTVTGVVSLDVEALLGRWQDLSHAFGFGPRSVAAVFVSFGGRSAALFLDRAPVPEDALTVDRDGDDLLLTAAVPLEGVWVSGGRPDDNAFALEPGVTRRLHAPGAQEVTALGLTPVPLPPVG